jgi:hypothetical protein
LTISKALLGMEAPVVFHPCRGPSLGLVRMESWLPPQHWQCRSTGKASGTPCEDEHRIHGYFGDFVREASHAAGVLVELAASSELVGLGKCGRDGQILPVLDLSMPKFNVALQLPQITFWHRSGLFAVGPFSGF